MPSSAVITKTPVSFTIAADARPIARSFSRRRPPSPAIPSISIGSWRSGRSTGGAAVRRTPVARTTPPRSATTTRAAAAAVKPCRRRRVREALDHSRGSTDSGPARSATRVRTSRNWSFMVHPDHLSEVRRSRSQACQRLTVHGLHGPYAHAQRPGCLDLGQVLVVAQHHHSALARGQPL